MTAVIKIIFTVEYRDSDGQSREGENKKRERDSERDREFCMWKSVLLLEFLKSWPSLRLLMFVVQSNNLSNE